MTSANDRTPMSMDLRELDVLRQLNSHKEIATARAMDYCATHQINPPEWLVESAASLMVDLLKREKSSRRGRAAGCLARFRQQYWDTERWDAVHEVRRVRDMAKQDRDALESDPDRAVSDGWKKVQKKRNDWLKQGTFEWSTQLLRGRDAYASPSAIRASYRRVERSKGSHVLGAWFDDPFLRRLGLQAVPDRKPGTKPSLYFT